MTALFYLFHEDHGEVIDFDAHDDQENRQRDVGDDCDEREVAYRDEDSKDGTQNPSRGRRILPVHEILYSLFCPLVGHHGAALWSPTDRAVSCRAHCSLAVWTPAGRKTRLGY